MTNQIIYGDCLKVLPTLPRARMIFADPPDNLGMKYDGFKDRWPCRVAYCDWLCLVILASLRAGDVFWLSCFYAYQDFVWSLFERVRDTREFSDLSCRMFPWVYSFGQHRTDDCGNGYRPLFRFHRGAVEWNTDAIRVQSQRQRNGDKRADPRGRVPDDVWEFSRVCGTFKEKRQWHKNQHPEALIERMVRMSTKPGDLVVDLCAGTGTVNRVCRRLDRNVIGIDISRTYCEKIAEETGAELIEHESAAKTLF